MMIQLVDLLSVCHLVWLVKRREDLFIPVAYPLNMIRKLLVPKLEISFSLIQTIKVFVHFLLLLHFIQLFSLLDLFQMHLELLLLQGQFAVDGALVGLAPIFGSIHIMVGDLVLILPRLKRLKSLMHNRVVHVVVLKLAQELSSIPFIILLVVVQSLVLMLDFL